MRIQHNIMAMNAYRNYNNNTSALSSNLEKLSSGYKINRAGDDAAGLAISEKMRAQITGLEAAQKNVKDGISLVKTAEGAMQEIQDMLNRMDYLATQSANGTYQDEVDREALQKEVEQLKSEIDRIADSANFNGIKLLDGTWDVDALENAKKAAAEAAKPVAVDGVYGDPMSVDDIKGLMLTESTSNNPASTVDGVGLGTILETDGTGEVVPSFKLSLDGINFTVSDTNGAGTMGFTITDAAGAAQKLTLTEKQIADAAGITAKGGKVDSETLAKAFADKNAVVTLDGIAYDVTADGKDLVFTAQTNPTTETNPHYKVSFSSAVTSGNVQATGATFTTSTFTDGTGAGTDHVGTIVAKIDGKDVTFTTPDTAAAATGGAWATAMGNATATIDGKAVKLSDYFDVAYDGTGKTFTFTDKTTGAEGSGNSITSVAIAKGATAGDTVGSFAATDITKADGVDAYKTGADGYSNFGTQDIKVNVQGTKDELASTTLDLTGKLTDGAKIKLGDTEYTIAVGPDSKYADAENVVKVNKGATEAEIASALSDAADSNGTFTVGHEKDTAKITLKQKEEVKDSTDMSTMDKFASYIGITTIDANATAEKQKEADAEQAKKLADANAKVAELTKAGAKALNLQIGDTSDDFNQLGVKIGSMKTEALGIADLSISTAEDAAGAIDTIKNAINYVSSVRGDLGAYQNRLEHTANNLSVMAENITDAESTIRDTDVAEEMMSYVKNNILVQSAQAMLAQANQVPQGVLQLLG